MKDLSLLSNSLTSLSTLFDSLTGRQGLLKSDLIQGSIDEGYHFEIPYPTILLDNLIRNSRNREFIVEIILL